MKPTRIAVLFTVVPFLLAGCATYQLGARTPTVYYATDRQRDNSANDEDRFTGERGSRDDGTPIVHSGYVEAFMDLGSKPGTPVRRRRSHLPEVEQPWRLRQTRTTRPQEHAAMKQKPVDGLIFVHGFNVSFESVAQRVTRLAYDLKQIETGNSFDGPVAFFSWPVNRGRLHEYVYDHDTVVWSTPQLTQFILDFQAAFKLDQVHILSHSTGARAVARSVTDLQSKSPSIKLGALIFAAADIDAQVFQHVYLDGLAESADGVYVYINKDDRALNSSSVVRARRAHRLGADTTALLPSHHPNVHYLDVTEACRIYDTSFRHSSLWSCLIDDIGSIIQYGSSSFCCVDTSRTGIDVRRKTPSLEDGG